MKNSTLRKISFIFTILYCCICLLSAGMTLLGAYAHKRSLFSAGNALIPFWLLNPMGTILVLLGVASDARKKEYGWMFLFMTISWIIAGILIASIM